jgi:hypothetical protein
VTIPIDAASGGADGDAVLITGRNGKLRMDHPYISALVLVRYRDRAADFYDTLNARNAALTPGERLAAMHAANDAGQVPEGRYLCVDVFPTLSPIATTCPTCSSTAQTTACSSLTATRAPTGRCVAPTGSRPRLMNSAGGGGAVGRTRLRMSRSRARSECSQRIASTPSAATDPATTASAALVSIRPPGPSACAPHDAAVGRDGADERQQGNQQGGVQRLGGDEDRDERHSRDEHDRACVHEQRGNAP